MTSAALPIAAGRPNLIRPIIVGGAIAGTLDLIAAFITYGIISPKFIAAGLIGRQAISGGDPAWTLGVLLHFLIAFSTAAVYCVSSRRLEFLKEHFLVCGMFYGVAIFLVMNLVVLPLCAFARDRPLSASRPGAGLDGSHASDRFADFLQPAQTVMTAPGDAGLRWTGPRPGEVGGSRRRWDLYPRRICKSCVG